MKKAEKTISIVLTIIMLFSVLDSSSINIFAAEEEYTPLESGRYDDFDMLSKYQYNIVGHGSEIFALNEILLARIKPTSISLAELEENEIIDDYRLLYSDYELGEINVECYGVLSDGSKLLLVNAENLAFLTEFYYVVIDEYLTTNSDSRYLVYKDNQFLGLNAISEDLLDETAEILQFAKFVNSNEQIETEPTTIQPATTTVLTNSVSTPDTPLKNNSGNITNPNNSNGSIPTGQNNFIALFIILILGASVIILLSVKNKMNNSL